MAANKDDGGFKKFAYNSDTGGFSGRTVGGWFKILGFYVIFYSCLAGVFLATIQAMLLTLSNYRPTWQDRIRSPGLSHYPRSAKSEVSFNLNDGETYDHYTRAMEAFMAKYDDELQMNQMMYEDCGDMPENYTNRGDLESDVGIRKACRFSRSWLGPCSGIEDQEFGYNEGKPCVIVTLNRIVDFLPMPLNPNYSAPEEVRSKVQANVIPVHCTNKREEDAGLMGEVKYYGIGGGFPLQYYPYYGKLLHPHYLQPLVAVQFVNITMNRELRIVCRIYGKNIEHSQKDRHLGRFDIKLTVAN